MSVKFSHYCPVCGAELCDEPILHEASSHVHDIQVKDENGVKVFKEFRTFVPEHFEYECPGLECDWSGERGLVVDGLDWDETRRN